MKPDDPRLGGYDLRATFNIDPDAPWPRPGEVTAIIATAVAPASPPQRRRSARIVLNPSRYLDQKVTITGQFSGRNLLGDLPDAPAKSRYDFVLRSADAAIWVINMRPKCKDAAARTSSSRSTRASTRAAGSSPRHACSRDAACCGSTPRPAASAGEAADRDARRGRADPRAGRPAAGSDLQRADAGRNRRLDDDDRADSVFARPRSGDAEGTRPRHVSRVAERRARRADDAAGRVHDAVLPARTACWRSRSRSRSSASAR